MGTSVNQRSPSRGVWAAQQVVLGNTSIPLDRQIIEIWRAAFGDRDYALADELCSTEIVRAARIANSSARPSDAATAFENVLYESDSGSLAVEFARRSLVRAVSQQGGAAFYGADLFAETASYLVSRDLPSYVGAEGRVSSPRAAIDLKNTLNEMSRSAALRIASTFATDYLTTDAGWRAFIVATARALGAGGRNA